MIVSLCWTVAVFFAVVFGLAWPIAARLALAPVEKIAATAALSLIGVFLAGWIFFLTALPPATAWALPALVLLGSLTSRHAWRAVARDADVRCLCRTQLLVSGWCVGWAMLIASYSGGGWTGDWFEHWQRAQFFAEHWPRDFLFLGHYPLTARPPFANVVTAVFLQLTQDDFAHYQLVSTLLSSLVFLPGAMLARYFGGDRRTWALLGALLMLNPLFVQNATFAWTKLPAAFFVLTALYFFLRHREADAPRAALALFSLTLAAGILTHYSTGPYAVMLGGSWLILSWRAGKGSTRSSREGGAIVVGGGLLLTWFGWACIVYGGRGTFFTNTSVTGAHATAASQLGTIVLNLRDTVVPHFLRPLDRSLIAQADPWGGWRDWFFQLYQLNLFFAFGSIAWLAIASAARKCRATSARGARVFWASFVPGVILLGIAVHSPRDTWGLAHICLQPLVILGLAFLAAQWPRLASGWRLALAVGAFVDLGCGILWHFSVQHHSRSFWWGTWDAEEFFRRFSPGSAMNLAAKTQNHLRFLNDVFTPPPVVVLALLGGLLILAVRRAHPGVRAHPVPPRCNAT